MSFYPSAEAAYGAAIGQAVTILRSADAPDDVAHRIAEDIINGMVRDGWKWVYREPTPPLRSGAKPGPMPDHLRDARAELQAELERQNARWHAQAHAPAPDPTPTT